MTNTIGQTNKIYEKQAKALEEAKTVTRELHEAIKDASRLQKEFKHLMEHSAEDLVIDCLKHILPIAIGAAEQKAADDLLKLNKALKEVFLERVQELREKMEDRDKEINKLTKAVVLLHTTLSKDLNLGLDN